MMLLPVQIFYVHIQSPLPVLPWSLYFILQIFSEPFSKHHIMSQPPFCNAQRWFDEVLQQIRTNGHPCVCASHWNELALIWISGKLDLTLLHQICHHGRLNGHLCSSPFASHLLLAMSGPENVEPLKTSAEAQHNRNGPHR
jgi:hypothetical protein